MQSWGRLESALHRVVELTDEASLPAQLQAQKPGIAYGQGRSYGDVCLNPGGTLWRLSALDHFLSWDAQTGLLCCEGGILLQDIQRTLLPQGWLLPVTPGTQLVSVGGAIANDVHGKNHHGFGSFGDHVRRLWLARSDGTVLECSRALEPQCFAATVGGLGLTGVIVRAELQLRRVPGPWLDTHTQPFRGLDEFFALADGSEPAWEHSVAWIDCLTQSRGGVRGIFLRANPSTAQTGPQPAKGLRRLPVTPPVSLVNALTLRPFNAAYYRLQRHRAGSARQHYETFFYPLDGLMDWNRMYGPRGFYQYQSVVPPGTAREATEAMLQAIARSGEGSFLAVLKTFGARPSPGLLSFARPGTTLALDFPNRGERTARLFERLDAIVREAGGALYPAKDARMPRALFEAGFPRLNEFLQWRDPGMSSALSRRLLGS
ncbi:FAD-binding oxidoreductase [Roseateles flavus]|uniref:FAD-binding oxidoreductase n=1 Tax=Roseateles flavus TaxID=3149041 RepID=A0ABV0GKM4_9BURK